MESNVTDKDRPRIPWPGPQPYDEEDWDDFSGRDSTLEQLLNRVSVDKLTVLLGASGTGKTSLIRAGLVPLLRHGRYHPAEGNQATWPVLLLRRWGAVGSSSLKENLLLQLHSAITAIHDWGEMSAQPAAIVEAANLRENLESVISKAGSTGGILEIVEGLARAQARRAAEGAAATTRESGITLIFDQFEEQLRAGRRASSEALDLIGNLVRGTAPIRVLVSMRREYQYALRGLELLIGGLSGRSVFLESLEAPDLLKVIQDSSKNSQIPISQEVADSIVKWLSSTNPESRNGAVPDGGLLEQLNREIAQEERGRPDLLQVQAVLLELCHYASERGRSTVDRQVFESFGAQFLNGAGGAHVRSGAIGADRGEDEEVVEEELARRVLGGALERWIESALKGTTKRGPRRSQTSSRSRSHAAWADMDEKDLLLQVRRVAVRLAPRLSSGDYKVSQEENTLFRQALGEEIARLGLKDPERRSKTRIVENESGPPTLNWRDLEFGESQTEDGGAQSTLLSGLARVKGWNLTTAGDQILICFREALHRLAAANILQCTYFGGEKGLYWELVHDQFGPSFTRWAERQRGTWDDCKSSLVVCSGLQPIVVPVQQIQPPDGSAYYELLKISWQGCSVESSTPKHLVLKNVTFKECFLVGTIFDNIDFVGSTFERCELVGVLFRNCIFRSDERGRPTMFTRCDSNVAIVNSTIKDLEFRDCHLEQPTIARTKLEGNVRYLDGSRVIQGFYDVTRGEVAVDVGIRFSPDSSAAFCTTSTASFGFVDFPLDPELHNRRLKDDFRTRTASGEQKG